MKYCADPERLILRIPPEVADELGPTHTSALYDMTPELEGTYLKFATSESKVAVVLELRAQKRKEYVFILLDADQRKATLAHFDGSELIAIILIHAFLDEKVMPFSKVETLPPCNLKLEPNPLLNDPI